MVDTVDLKSADREVMRVRFSPGAQVGGCSSIG